MEETISANYKTAGGVPNPSSGLYLHTVDGPAERSAMTVTRPGVARPHGLNDEECAAIRALQEAAAAPHVEHPVWAYLVSSSLVWIDRSVMPATVRLTPTGRSCPVE